MASNVLHQAFLFVNGNHATQFPPLKKQVGFQLGSFRRLSISNTQPTNVFSSIPSKSSFIVQAQPEPSSEVPDEGATIAVEDVPEVEAEPEPEPRFPRVKLANVMGILNKKAVEASVELRVVPEIRTGDIVQIRLEIPENKRRLSLYKGIVISRQNAGIHTTIRVRRIIAGVGVEIVFPLYSPNIKEIKVVDHRKVRKARLYYLRDKLPRLSTFK